MPGQIPLGELLQREVRQRIFCVCFMQTHQRCLQRTLVVKFGTKTSKDDILRSEHFKWPYVLHFNHFLLIEPLIYSTFMFRTLISVLLNCTYICTTRFYRASRQGSQSTLVMGHLFAGELTETKRKTRGKIKVHKLKSRILIFTHPGSRILDPGPLIQKQQQKRGMKKFVVIPYRKLFYF
jgi:hypothetical protein